jgi:hypothetical protein
MGLQKHLSKIPEAFNFYFYKILYCIPLHSPPFRLSFVQLNYLRLLPLLREKTQVCLSEQRNIALLFKTGTVLVMQQGDIWLDTTAQCYWIGHSHWHFVSDSRFVDLTLWIVKAGSAANSLSNQAVSTILRLFEVSCSDPGTDVSFAGRGL